MAHFFGIYSIPIDQSICVVGFILHTYLQPSRPTDQVAPIEKKTVLLAKNAIPKTPNENQLDFLLFSNYVYLRGSIGWRNHHRMGPYQKQNQHL